jgi:hypothetical protein
MSITKIAACKIAFCSQFTIARCSSSVIKCVFQWNVQTFFIHSSMVDGSGKNRDKHITSTLSERMDGESGS